MKRILIFLASVVMTAMAFQSCSEKNEPEKKVVDAHEIIGHTYAYIENKTNYISFYFSHSGQIHLLGYNKGEKVEHSHLTYLISDYKVEVYRDNSDYWAKAEQGTLSFYMTYNPTYDCLYWEREGSTFIYERQD